jgi:ectoine hydroxylase-related dioxygenase (phytanoyl-CoA dioxygenase family)
VQPHTHVDGDMFTNEYSLSAYLNLPQEKSSLTFLTNRGDTTNFCVEVRKGDVLIFPSNLCHYSNDCHEGRIILSSNFRIDHQEQRND